MRDTEIEDSDLVGGDKEKPLWKKGFNGVYKKTNGLGFRVSLKTESGWHTFGYFDNLETAAYVANVAILSNNLEKKYKINKGVKPNKEELGSWLFAPKENELMHNIAKDKFLKDAELEFPTLSYLNMTEQYIENIKKGYYPIEKLQEMKKQTRPGGPISSAIDAAISKDKNHK